MAFGVALGAMEVGGATGAEVVVGVAAFGGATSGVNDGGAAQPGAVGVFAHLFTAAS
jgi:hypothetical protein